jgi:uncharacterized membrane protein YcaP (DUF421 family)
MGKRQLGQMEPSEFVVAMLLANLASIPLENPDLPIHYGLVPMGLIFGAEIGLSWLSLHNIRIRRLLCGKPVILIDNGKLVMSNLRRARINLDELSCHLRNQGILAVEVVQFAILETNGTITVFPFPQFQPATARDAGVEAAKQEMPYTVISDGQLLEANLRLLGRDRRWLNSFLTGKSCSLGDVVLLTVTQSGQTCLIRRLDTA